MRFLCAVAVLAVAGASAASPDVTGPYIAAEAPRENIFAPISVDEANAIKKFLERESNVTM
jgi:hypothetical protein